jgi:hypothetical protein
MKYSGPVKRNWALNRLFVGLFYLSLTVRWDDLPRICGRLSWLAGLAV